MKKFGEDISLIERNNLTDLEKATAAKVIIRMYGTTDPEEIKKINADMIKQS